MVEIKIRLQINTSQERVWDIISDIDNDLDFWRGITSIRNISREGNVTTREIILGTNNKCIQKLVICPKEEISIRWVKGVITGTKVILLTPIGHATLLEVQMNYNFSGVGNLASKRLATLFQDEAEFAVEMIKEKSEWRERHIPMTTKKSWLV
ncbi:MAG: SRPBCC family protein [Nitrosotalea sp.]